MFVLIPVPKHVLKKIQNTDSINKENNKPNGNAKGIKKTTKVSQVVSSPVVPKVKGISVPRKPNTIEAAFENFNIDELNAQIETMKANFPNNHLVWLKGVSYYHVFEVTVN